MTATPVTSLGLRNVLKRVLAAPYPLIEVPTYRIIPLRTVEGHVLNLRLVPFNASLLQVLIGVPGDPAYAQALAEIMLSKLVAGPTLTGMSLGIIDNNLCWACTQQDAVPDLVKLLHTMIHAQMCACGQHIIIDNQNCCFTCHLNLTPEGLSQHTCPVCLEQCVAPIQETTCCKQWIHVACLKKHLNLSQNKGCPLCRTLSSDDQANDQNSEADFVIPLSILQTLPDIGQILSHM